jgi:CheY-like chemotaxis protein/HPt (histidine-containing phosphotransfer) domain-containing protein
VRQPVRLLDLPVLVVDDNATNRRILVEMLANWRMRPQAVDSGRAALAALRQAVAAGEPFPLALLDAHMPEMDGFTLARSIQQSPELAGTTLLMLTSAGPSGDAAGCRELGIQAYLSKPIKQSELLDAILTVLGSRSLEESGQAGPAAIPSPAHRALRILLAEDNVINQKVTVRMLEKQGHTVFVVGNGRQAVERLAAHEGQLDAVLMDVQMPEMDGLEATALIRQGERGTGRHVPIIAMTAHAMKGDRERCLDAGMDGYVAKPVQLAELVQTLAECVPSERAAAAPSPLTPNPSPLCEHPPSSPSSEPIVNAAELLARFSRNMEFLAEIVGIFLDRECPQLMQSVRDAVTDTDAERLRRAVHTLKGTVGTFNGDPAYEAAMKVEMLARDGDWTAISKAVTELEDEIGRLQMALARLVGKKGQ